MEQFFQNYQIIYEAVGGFVAVLSAIGALWWKISKAFAGAQLDLEGLKKNFEKLAATNIELTKIVVQMSTKLDEREKDIAKVEGAIDVQRRDMMNVISGLQQATSSLDAVWRTLQSLFPAQVPRRASDK